MRKSHLLAVIATGGMQVGSSIAGAQSPDSAREAAYQQYWAFPSLIAGGTVQPRWLGDGTSFWYAEGGPANTMIYRVDPRDNTKAPFFDLARVRRVLASHLGHEPPYRGLPFDEFSLDTTGAARFAVEARTFALDLSTYTLREVALSAAERERTTPKALADDEGRAVPELASPDGRWFLGQEDYNLTLRSTADGRFTRLTTDGTSDHRWVMNEMWSVRPNEARWAPDGIRLAAFRLDLSKVGKQPIVHWLTPEEHVRLLYNPVAGGPIAQTQLVVFDVLSKTAVPIESGTARDVFLYVAGWRPDGKELWYYRMTRDFRQLDLMAADAITGASRVVFTETSKTFLNGYEMWWGLTGAETAVWVPRTFTPLWDRQQFLWLSERDGWRHIYLHGFDGALVRRLTTGSFPVHRILAVDEKAGWIYFTASDDPKRVYDIHLYRVRLDGTGYERLTMEPGRHELFFSPSREYFVDVHTSLERPVSSVLYRADGTRLQELSAADTSALAALRRQPVEAFVAKAADGMTDLHGVLFKPAEFDPRNRYPVLEVFYPGDQVISTPKVFALNNYGVRAQAWAQLGFITFVVDARGTPGRGKAFQDVVYLNHGRNEIPDHAAVVQQLTRQRPYMDSARVGVWGHSWGGYFAIRALLLAPEVYHVGVASAPLADLIATHYPTEPYMLTPQENPAGYEYARNTKFAGNLKGRLLMIVGSNDQAHLMGQVFRQAEAFIQAEKLFDMMILPEQGHGYTGAGARFAERYVRRYFETHLRPDRAAVSTDVLN